MVGKMKKPRFITNIYDRALVIFIWINGLLIGFLMFDYFGWIGIISLIVMGYILIILIPEFLDKRLGLGEKWNG